MRPKRALWQQQITIKCTIKVCVYNDNEKCTRQKLPHFDFGDVNNWVGECTSKRNNERVGLIERRTNRKQN